MAGADALVRARGLAVWAADGTADDGIVAMVARVSRRVEHGAKRKASLSSVERVSVLPECFCDEEPEIGSIGGWEFCGLMVLQGVG